MTRICSNCNSPLEEDALFCAVCGTRVEAVQQPVVDNTPVNTANTEVTEQVNTAPANENVVEEPIIPSKPQETASAVDEGKTVILQNEVPVYDNVQNANIPNGAAASNDWQNVNNQNTANVKKSKKAPKGLIIALVVVAAAAVLLIVGILGFTLIKSGNKGAKQYAFYLKDGSLYTVEGKGKPIEVTSKLYSDSYGDSSNLRGEYFYRNGKKVYFTEKIDSNYYSGEMGSFAEMNLNKPNEKNKIDSDVYPSGIFVNKDYSKILYIKVDDDSNEYTWYRYDVKKKSKEKITSTGYYDLYASDDLNNFLYIDDEYRLYAKFGNKDKVKIDDDVDDVYGDFSNLNPQSEIFYIKYDDEDDVESLWVYKKGEKKQLLEGDYVYVNYFDSKDAYFLSYDNDDDETDIYYYDGKNYSVVATAEGYRSSWDMYTRSDSLSESKIPMMTYMDEDEEYHLLVQKTDIILSDLDSKDYLSGVVCSKDGKKIFLETVPEGKSYWDGDTTGLLYSVVKTGTNYTLKKEKEIYGLSIYSSFFNKNNQLVYIQDYDPDESTGSLYVGDFFVASDVRRVITDDEYKKMYFLADYSKASDGSFSFSLYELAGKKKKMISSDVSGGATALKDGGVYYIYDYSSKHESGELYYYNGGKPSKIDGDVEAFTISAEPSGMSDF